jgi:hypothetical protein
LLSTTTPEHHNNNKSVIVVGTASKVDEVQLCGRTGGHRQENDGGGLLEAVW